MTHPADISYPILVQLHEYKPYPNGKLWPTLHILVAAYNPTWWDSMSYSNRDAKSWCKLMKNHILVDNHGPSWWSDMSYSHGTPMEHFHWWFNISYSGRIFPMTNPVEISCPVLVGHNIYWYTPELILVRFHISYLGDLSPETYHWCLSSYLSGTPYPGIPSWSNLVKCNVVLWCTPMTYPDGILCPWDGNIVWSVRTIDATSLHVLLIVRASIVVPYSVECISDMRQLCGTPLHPADMIITERECGRCIAAYTTL